jgi:DMSO/TMAO reductase YedYZ molybdopterin-dependent catalytic subunit
MQPVTRRRWLLEALALASLPGTIAALEPGEEVVSFLDDRQFQPGVREANPRVKCYDLRRLPEPVTPNANFFVFHQTTVPPIDIATWALQIGGLVARPATLDLAGLSRIAPAVHDLEFTLECAGNLPRPEIMNGQVGNARWSGFRLATVLHACGVKPEAREVVFFGADQVRDSAGVAFGPHGRSIFVQDIMDSEAILATHMNGEVLPADHGFPLRLIIPGWYGMAQIKWLSRIEVIDRRFEGAHMSRNYHTLHVVPGGSGEPLTIETSISKTRLKSVVARVTRRRQNDHWVYRVAGAAWGGPRRIERVDVQLDRGAWQATRIEERRGKYAWLMWSFETANLAPGRHVLCSRAIDDQGNVQPSHDERRSRIRSAREDNSQWEREIEIPG